MTSSSIAAVGVDVGGTFTDFCAFTEDGSVRTWKRLSTPDAPERAVVEGLEGVPAERVVHGSTVATNALLERHGARTALVVTEGFGDILEIRRQVRPHIYDLEPRRSAHVVARADVVEVRERMSASGSAVIGLEGSEVTRLVEAVRSLGVEAVAVCLLYGYRDTAHEAWVAAAFREAGFDVSASHEVLPEHREYERASTTAINAYLRPRVRGYLGRLASAVPGLRVIQSSGGLAPIEQAGEFPVTMVTSGPAGGVLGALGVAKAAGYEDVLTFDMGGTSTDVSLCPGGEPRYRTAAQIDGLAVHTPMVDIVTVGAGGGSIARLDAGGALHAGPESAGADPGPACYGRGALPTVSDANAVLGRLRGEQLLAGSVVLDRARALSALAGIGEPAAAARAVIDVVNTNMAAALRQVSLERGFDPERFTLVAFGGAGPLHACELAAEVGIRRVLVPRHPGVLSALGMVTAPLAVERSLPTGADGGLPGDWRGALSQAVRNAAAEGGWTVAEIAAARESWAADVRYRGQGHELRVPLYGPPGSPADMEAAFHGAHEQRFGYADRSQPAQVVNLRLRLEAPGEPHPQRASPAGGTAPAPAAIEIDGRPALLYRRNTLAPGLHFAGPAVVVQDDATTFVAPGWAARIDRFENLVIEPAGLP